jgi:hypothetical protein
VKSAWIKGEKRIPGNPCSLSGYIPKRERSVSKRTSIIFTSHMKKINIPGMIILKRSFFL